MGGCASKPRESDPKALPAENVSAPEQAPQAAEAEVPTQDKVEIKEEPLVDISEPKPDAATSEGTESKASATDLAPETVAPASAPAEPVQTQETENVEAKQEGEQLKETTQQVVAEPAKAPETPEKKAEEDDETQKPQNVAEAEKQKSDVTPPNKETTTSA